MSALTEATHVRDTQIAVRPPYSTASPVRKWLHENPSVQNTAIAGLGALGITVIYEGLRDYSYYKVSMGAVLAGTAYVLNKVVPIFIPPTHNPACKVFKEEECRGASLVYKGNLPVLTIPKEVSPFDAGYARGFMMAAQIQDLIAKNDFAFHTVRGLPRKIPDLIEKIKGLIPAGYLKELEGIAAGYNDRRKEWVLKGKELSLDDLIYFHLLPDIGSLEFKEANNWVHRQKEDAMGCTTVIDGDSTTGPRAIRTVDWIAMDVYGKYGFVELRETSEGLRYAGQSFPLFAGVLTAMNAQGLCVAMNVARGLTDYPVRMPAVFYLRNLIENCVSIKGENGAENFWQHNSPLGPFNMTILDEAHAASVHFYQKDDRSHNVRWWQPASELVTLNFRYGERGETNPTPTNSAERRIEIRDYYQKLRAEGSYDGTDSSVRLRAILRGPEVNNIRTVSAAYMDPKGRIFETSFDNGYAADRPRQQIPIQEWFRR